MVLKSIEEQLATLRCLLPTLESAAVAPNSTTRSVAVPTTTPVASYLHPEPLPRCADKEIEEMYGTVYDRQVHGSMAEFCLHWINKVKHMSEPLSSRAFIRLFTPMLPVDIEETLLAARVTNEKNLFSLLRQLDAAADRRRDAKRNWDTYDHDEHYYIPSQYRAANPRSPSRPNDVTFHISNQMPEASKRDVTDVTRQDDERDVIDVTRQDGERDVTDVTRQDGERDVSDVTRQWVGLPPYDDVHVRFVPWKFENLQDEFSASSRVSLSDGDVLLAVPTDLREVRCRLTFDRGR